MGSREFAALVPVKSTLRGKSRLVALGDQGRSRLVLAFALDTITALLEAPAVTRVLVVTDDVDVALAASELGADAIPDGGDGMNDSLVQAAAEVARRWPELSLMAVVGDLPTLDRDAVEEIAEGFREAVTAFVPDAAGLGTTVYLARSYEEFAPQFGTGSAQLHRSRGAQEIALAENSSARQDIDTPEELERARGGLGAHTRLALTQLDLEGG